MLENRSYWAITAMQEELYLASGYEKFRFQLADTNVKIIRSDHSRTRHKLR